MEERSAKRREEKRNWRKSGDVLKIIRKIRIHHVIKRVKTHPLRPQLDAAGAEQRENLRMKNQKTRESEIQLSNNARDLRVTACSAKILRTLF